MNNQQEIAEHIIHNVESVNDDTPTDQLVGMLMMALSLMGVQIPPPENMEKETVSKWLEQGMSIVQTSSDPNIQTLFK